MEGFNQDNINFSWDKDLKEIKIPNNIKDIPASCFKMCINLVSIELPDKLEKIGESAFCGCHRLQTIQLPDSVKVIDPYAFAGCESLSNINLSGVECIGKAAFRLCDNLKRVDLSNIKGKLQNTFEVCPGLVEVTIGTELTDIGYATFTCCPQLSKINYLGTKQQWKSIKRNPRWKEYSAHDGLTVVCTDGVIRYGVN